jgi:hypothetical protein
MWTATRPADGMTLPTHPLKQRLAPWQATFSSVTGRGQEAEEQHCQ